MVNTVLVWIKSSQVVWKKNQTDSLTTSPLLQCLHRFTKRKWPSPPVRIPVGAARLWRAPPMASQLPTSAGSGGPGVPVFSAGSKKKTEKKLFLLLQFLSFLLVANVEFGLNGAKDWKVRFSWLKMLLFEGASDESSLWEIRRLEEGHREEMDGQKVQRLRKKKKT